MHWQLNNDRTQSNTWLFDEEHEFLHKISQRLDGVTKLKVANPFIQFNDEFEFSPMTHIIETSEPWQVGSLWNLLTHLEQGVENHCFKMSLVSLIKSLLTFTVENLSEIKGLPNLLTSILAWTATVATQITSKLPHSIYARVNSGMWQLSFYSQ